MWPALFAAAVAASTGLLAKTHLSKRAASSDPLNDVVSDDASPQSSTGSVSKPVILPWESDCEDQIREGVFRFSSDGGSGEKKSKKKKHKSKKNGENEEDEKKMKSRRRVGVSLNKKRKTVAASKCGSSSSDPKDTISLFNWGLNIGIMYMMTAGKAEISKLSTTMDETAKVVQELKSELNKRKASPSQQVSCVESGANTQYPSPSCKRTQTELTKSSSEEPNYMTASSFQISDVECPSSVLTEEQEAETDFMDMDQLEAELESELQKLPWCSTDAPPQEEFRNLVKDIVSDDSAQKFQGVLPAVLDQKLCHVLIEQQEGQIVELESELQSAQSKLQEKETELQALKDCVKRLTQLNLSIGSDDENEDHNGQEQTTNWNYNMEAFESIESVVGMKRHGFMKTNDTAKGYGSHFL